VAALALLAHYLDGVIGFYAAAFLLSLLLLPSSRDTGQREGFSSHHFRD
jgi:hypothetical protein